MAAKNPTPRRVLLIFCVRSLSELNYLHVRTLVCVCLCVCVSVCVCPNGADERKTTMPRARPPQQNHDALTRIRRQQEAIAKAAMGVSEEAKKKKKKKKRSRKRGAAHVPLRNGDAERLLSGEAFAVR